MEPLLINKLEGEINEKNNPVFRLDSIGPLNFPNMDKKKMHTAMGDCETCLDVMRKVKKEAGPIFQAAQETTSKIKAKEKFFMTWYIFRI